MLELIQTGWQDCWRSGWGLVLFILLPVGLLITTHFTCDLRLRKYSFLRIFFLSLIPYTMIWAIIALTYSSYYAPDLISPILRLLAYVVFFPLGPGVGWVLVQHTLGYSESQAGWAMVRWSIANLILVFLIGYIAEFIATRN
jgi:hypothetical protein